MSDLKKYVAKRKKTDKEFAKDYEEGFEDFKENKTFNKGDWKKAREILAKAPNVAAEDFDKL